MPRRAPRPVLIAGPTASGKSALALSLAERHGGVIVNADSMQVYRELPVLTARPPRQDAARAPHSLYGHVPAAEAYSVARWLADVAVVLGELREKGERAIIVGGTGLYFKALTEGLSPIPEIAPEVRERWRTFAADAKLRELHRELAARDPVMAARLEPADSQRLTRALEVIDATGRSLADWQSVTGTPLLRAADSVALVIDTPRRELHARCDRRFDLMMAAGAEAEVRSLLALSLDRRLPAFGALGVLALADWIEGRGSREAAAERGKLETRQYVKRQQTWLKRHMKSWISVQSNDYCKLDDRIDPLIDA